MACCGAWRSYPLAGSCTSVNNWEGSSADWRPAAATSSRPICHCASRSLIRLHGKRCLPSSSPHWALACWRWQAAAGDASGNSTDWRRSRGWNICSGRRTGVTALSCSAHISPRLKSAAVCYRVWCHFTSCTGHIKMQPLIPCSESPAPGILRKPYHVVIYAACGRG